MEVLDYLPIILVLISAFVGIAGKTWEPKKRGIARLTLQGKIVATIACLSFGYGIFTIYQTHQQLDQKTQLVRIANRQILTGMAIILKPLCHYTNDARPLSIDKVFETIRGASNLERIGHERLISTLGGTIVAKTSHGYVEVEYIYQLYDLYIEDGRNIINDAVIKFASVMSTQDIIDVEQVLQDAFFVNTYILSGKKSYFDLGLLDEKNGAVDGDSPWLTAGLHWFNAVYIKGKERAPEYTKFFAFLDKVKKAAASVSKNVADQTFDPCS